MFELRWYQYEDRVMRIPDHLKGMYGVDAVPHDVIQTVLQFREVDEDGTVIQHWTNVPTVKGTKPT